MLDFDWSWVQEHSTDLYVTGVALVILYALSRLSPGHTERVMSSKRREMVDTMFTKEVLYNVEDKITDGVERLVAEKKISLAESRALLYRTSKRYNMPNLSPRHMHQPDPTPAAADLKKRLLHGYSSLSDRVKGTIYQFLFNKPKEGVKERMQRLLIPKKS